MSTQQTGGWVRCVLGITDRETRARIRELLGASEVEIAAEASTGEELVRMTRSADIDLHVVDERLPGRTDQAVLDGLSRLRAVATVLICDPEHVPTHPLPEDVKSRTTRISRAVLAGDNAFGRSHLLLKLRMIAARCSRVKRTQSSGSLAHAMARVRTSAHRSGMRATLVDMVGAPLDMIAVLCGEAGFDRLVEIMRRTSATPVPILIAFENRGDAKCVHAFREAVSGYVPFTEVDGSLLLRGTRGMLLAGATGRIQLDDGVLVVTRGTEPLDLPALMLSLTYLADSAFVVLLPGLSRSLGTALATFSRAQGGMLAITDPLDPGAAADAVREGLAALANEPGEVAWVLSHALPIRR